MYHSGLVFTAILSVKLVLMIDSAICPVVMLFLPLLFLVNLKGRLLGDSEH
jgi:hypothetical protein